MARIPFDVGGKDACPVCLLSSNVDPQDRVCSGLALGLVSALVAQSSLELGELMASACTTHQQRIAQFLYGFCELSGTDYRVVFERLGARPAGPPPQGTIVHLAKGEQTCCGERQLADKWPDNERFVYEDKVHLVNCVACLTGS